MFDYYLNLYPLLEKLMPFHTEMKTTCLINEIVSRFQSIKIDALIEDKENAY